MGSPYQTTTMFPLKDSEGRAGTARSSWAWDWNCTNNQRACNKQSRGYLTRTMDIGSLFLFNLIHMYNSLANITIDSPIILTSDMAHIHPYSMDFRRDLQENPTFHGTIYGFRWSFFPWTNPLTYLLDDIPLPSSSSLQTAVPTKRGTDAMFGNAPPGCGTPGFPGFPASWGPVPQKVGEESPIGVRRLPQKWSKFCVR